MEAPKKSDSLEEKTEYARRVARERVKQLDSKFVEKMGEANLESDLMSEILQSLP